MESNDRFDNRHMHEASTETINVEMEKGGGSKKPAQYSKEDEKTKAVPFYKLFSFADSADIFLMIIGTVASVGNGVMTPLMFVLFGQLINSFGENQNSKDVVHEVAKVSLRFVCLGVASGVAAFLQVSCWMITGERQAARIRGMYLKTILRQDIAFFDKETSAGEVVGRMSGDTVLIQAAMGEKVGKFIQLMSTFIGGFIIAFAKGWLLALVMLSSIPLLVLVGSALSMLRMKMSSRGQSAYTKAAHVVEQTTSSIRTVASFTGEKQAIASYNEHLVTAYKAGISEGFASGLGLGVVMLIMYCTYALSIWFGGKMILEKGYTGGDVVNVLLSILNGSMSLGQASPCLSAFNAGQAAAYKMFETINRKPEIDAYDTRGKVLDDIHGDIELRDVYFSYPARPEEQIFTGFSLSIPSGTTVALVGQSGSGKSTVISLIERFYDPQSGEVLIDDVNIKEFQLKWLREKIGLVSQEPVLFSSSIRDNIAYGKDGATTEEIKAAAELANAAKFIDKLPEGLDTMVGEHGMKLSGGQKQRVAIARAILKDPRILLLDEATSALDAESERAVQEALDKVMINRTTVIVAHRLSTVRNANMIAVIQHGMIIEKGSHSELVKDANGAYSQLLRLQEMINEESEHKNCSDVGSFKQPDAWSGSFRQSSLRDSLRRIFSRGSYGSGRSLSRSFSFLFGIQRGTSVRTNATTKHEEEEEEVAYVQNEKQIQDVSIQRLASLNKPEIPALTIGSIAAIINGLVYPVFGILVSKALKSFYDAPHDLRKETQLWALMFMALGLVCMFTCPVQSFFFSLAGCKLIQRIRSMCFEKVVHMEVSWFDEAEHSSGIVGARLSADTTYIRALVGDTLAQLVQNIASAVAGLVIAFTASWQLALIVLALLPLIGLNGYFEVKFMRGFSADAKKMYEDASQAANDAVRSIRTVASFCAEERVMQLYQKKSEGPINTGMRLGLVNGTALGTSIFLMFSVYATSFYTGALLVKHGFATFSDVFQVFFALAMVAIGISQSSSIAPDSVKAKAAISSIFEIIDRKSTIDPSEESGMTLDTVEGAIRFRNVSFRYPSRPDIQIFQDLSLTIHSGKTLALVGESGSGKSTVISLLQRFYDPDLGHITLDRVDIQKLKIKWLRQQMGLVSQEPVLFNDTIRANIAYGKEGNATEAEILAASKLANAHNFVSSLQQGYDTVVGERGVQLSGGQKQRIAIARAIVKNPKIFLLDEATSALDAESEKVVQEALDHVMVNKTTIAVAHRLSTIKNADVIAVVKNGTIVEKGKHESLINIKDGFYASLVALHTNAFSLSDTDIL